MNTVKLFTLYVHIAPNNKKYFGITGERKVEFRWGEGGDGYCTQQRFWRAIQKYGWDNFQHIVLLEGLTKEVACECEKYLIAKYQSNNTKYGYNISAGGDLVQLGLKRTPEQIKHISDGHKGLPLTQAQIHHLDVLHQNLKGVPRSEEVKKKISQSTTGKTRSKEYRAALSERMRGNSCSRGIKRSEETKEKLRQANLGKKASDETKKKLSNNNARYWAGKTRSEETRQKISQTLTGRPSCRRGAHMSEESKRKLSEKQKERLKDVDLTGSNNGFYGKHHTPETIEKIRQASIRNAQMRRERKLQNDC